MSYNYFIESVCEHVKILIKYIISHRLKFLGQSNDSILYIDTINFTGECGRHAQN